MTFSVNPADLQAGSRIAGGSAADMQGLPATLGRVFRLLGESFGSADAAAAGAGAARRWQPAAEGVAREASALARGLGDAGGEYAAAERAQTARFAAPQ